MTLNQTTLGSFFQDIVGLNDIKPDTPLFSSGLLDSVSMVNLLAFFEQASGLVVRAEDVTLENFDTPDRILRFAEAST